MKEEGIKVTSSYLLLLFLFLFLIFGLKSMYGPFEVYNMCRISLEYYVEIFINTTINVCYSFPRRSLS